MSNSLIHYRSLVRSTSKIVAAVEKCKLKLPMQRKYPIHGAGEEGGGCGGIGKSKLPRERLGNSRFYHQFSCGAKKAVALLEQLVKDHVISLPNVEFASPLWIRRTQKLSVS